MATNLFRVGQILKGRAAYYTITNQIYRDSVWFARNNLSQKQVVIKSVSGHPRVEHECKILRLFDKSSLLRPLVDEIDEPGQPTTIVLEYLDADLDQCSRVKTLNRYELKYVTKKILQALEVLHSQGYVHTDVKLMNVLINFSTDTSSNRFSDVKLCDFGETYHVESEQARNSLPIGASIWRSPEAQMQIDNGWNTATDIWSFGLCVISLIYGSGIHLITPSVSSDHDDYEFEVLKRQFMFFGPVPETYIDQVQGREDLKQVLLHLFEVTPADQRGLFKRITKAEMAEEDSVFLQKIMKWDWRDRPTAMQLLEDDWFKDVVEEEPVPTLPRGYKVLS